MTSLHKPLQKIMDTCEKFVSFGLISGLSFYKVRDNIICPIGSSVTQINISTEYIEGIEKIRVYIDDNDSNKIRYFDITEEGIGALIGYILCVQK
jgi:hypothetical protein